MKGLEERDWDTLRRAADLRRRFNAGIFPLTIGDRSHFLRLERLGLLEFDAMGRDIDGLNERDVHVYKLTDLAIDELRAKLGEGE